MKNKIENILQKLKEQDLHMANMISFSKTAYLQKHPKNEVCFNANLFLENGKKAEKIWYGDIDITLSGEIIQNIANEEQVNLYILREHDGRFEKEKQTLTNVKELAKARFICEDL